MPTDVISAPRTDSEPSQTVRASSLVVIVSTVGAGDGISQILSSIPRGTSAAFLAFPDVRRGFSSLLCDRLRSECSLAVHEILEGRPLCAGSVVVVPAQFGADVHEESPGGDISCDSLPLEGKPAELATRIRSSCRLAGAVFGKRAIAVMLSGLAGDGVDAMSQIKAAGGQVVTIDDASALVHDGPRAVASANIADDVLPLWAIGSHIAEVVETL